MIVKGMVENIVSVHSPNHSNETDSRFTARLQEVPTLAKAVFHEESFRSSIKIESSDHEVSEAPIDPRKKSEIVGQRLFELASQCKARSSVSHLCFIGY
jgi:hypothetical protein